MSWLKLIAGVLWAWLVSYITILIGHALNWFGIAEFIGPNWYWLVCGTISLIIGFVGFIIGFGFIKEREEQIKLNLDTFFIRHKYLKILIFLIIAGLIAYCVYRAWLYNNLKYPARLALIFAIANVAFNVVFIYKLGDLVLWIREYTGEVSESSPVTYERTFSDGSKDTVTERNNMGCAIAIAMYYALFCVCYYDYKYLIAPVFGLDEKIFQVTTVNKSPNESQISQTVNKTKKNDAKKTTKKTSKHKKSNASNASDAS